MLHKIYMDLLTMKALKAYHYNGGNYQFMNRQESYMASEIPGISSSPLSPPRSFPVISDELSPVREHTQSLPAETTVIRGSERDKPPSRQQMLNAFQGADKPAEPGPSPEEKPNLISDLLERNKHKLLPMEWKKTPKDDIPAPVPCDGRAVTAAFRQGEGVLCGKPGFFSHQVRMLEVKEPETLGEAADLLVFLANQEKGLVRREYGLMFYSNEKGESKFLLERGTGAIFTPDLHKYRVIETPDRQQWLLLGCIGHTHPFSGEGNPSEKDLSALKNSDTGLNQRFSIVAAQGGWHLFNSSGAYEPDQEALAKPISGLLDI
jgi:hypothetical protein